VRKMEVCILPLGEVEGQTLAFLNEKLSKIFGSARILGRSEIPEHAFNHLRMQYNSTVILYHPVACKTPSEREGIRKGRWEGNI